MSVVNQGWQGISESLASTRACPLEPPCVVVHAFVWLQGLCCHQVFTTNFTGMACNAAIHSGAIASACAGGLYMGPP